ncbi:response regulator transcription factor [Ramlibacter aquaticus]|uniref:Response regulator transcription factor n=1 Tax=Ramlibacter aquaticus TaxID=2780094 RepID=A0ABR9SK72_9BURK|nr:response regulator transcription factor [Ramlibacter aquaticus]
MSQPGTSGSIRVFVIARPMHAWGLAHMLQSAGDRLVLAGTAADPSEAARLAGRHEADVILALLEQAVEFEEIARLLDGVPAKLVVLTACRDTAVLDQAVMAGARGVLRTDDPPAALLKALERVHAGELWIDRVATGRIFLAMARQKAAEGSDPERNRISTLTQRERQTIAAITCDAKAPAKVVAARMCISEHTLRNHLTSIYSKLELSNRVDLYAFATRHHLTSLR